MGYCVYNVGGCLCMWTKSIKDGQVANGVSREKFTKSKEPANRPCIECVCVYVPTSNHNEKIHAGKWKEGSGGYF